MRISDWSSDVCSSDLTDIDPPHTCVSQHFRMVSKLRAVRGQRQFLKRPALQMTTDPPHQLAKLAPHERLPAAQANFPDAARNETVCNDGDLLQRKNLVDRKSVGSVKGGSVSVGP